MSFQPGPYGRNPYIPSPRTPGPLGINDAASPDAPAWLVGDTPGPLGVNDWANPQCEFFSLMHKKMGASPVRQANIATEIHYEDLYNHLSDPRWEGKVAHMYVDTRGYVTVGVGNMLKSAAEAKKLDFVNADTGKTATEKEIETAFEAVSKMAKAHRAPYYKQKPSIELKEQTVKELAIKRLKEEFIPGLQKICDGFDHYPASAKQALIDMAYNLGLGGLKEFKKLIAAAKKGDWQAAANESNRKSCRKERNEWTRERFEKAAPGQM